MSIDDALNNIKNNDYYNTLPIVRHFCDDHKALVISLGIVRKIKRSKNGNFVYERNSKYLCCVPRCVKRNVIGKYRMYLLIPKERLLEQTTLG